MKRFKSIIKAVLRPVRAFARKYPLLFVSVAFGVAIIASSLVIASTVQRKTDLGFNTEKVLPAPVTQPSAASTVYTSESIKRYDGKDGHKCYVAVDGTVYEISGKALWQGGQHSPSGGLAYCGADMTEALKKSPHGASKLQELPKVGVFSDNPAQE